MTADSVTTPDVERALREMSRLLVGTCDDLAQATARAEAAEAEIDELVYVLTDLVRAVAYKKWDLIDLAVENAKLVLVGARGERVAP